ncbi:MAG TPA: T9SS type A sorting domain-containing protein [Chitinophagaceae bacterium]|jgi:hypothetical protein|nr:T9SS type A sorting domain-containing protein [Chitinophagaceae bacterium]
MKVKFFLLLSFFSAYIASAQLTITPGSQFAAVGDVQLTLQNTDLVNFGNFTPGNSIVSFTGNDSARISGSEPVQFFKLVINKSNNAAVILERLVTVRETAFFSSGFLDLNNTFLDLDSTGRLENERNESRVIGFRGGEVVVHTKLDAPASENPGNLGAIISSSQNMGRTEIRRGHQSQSAPGLVSSISRSYTIISENGINLNATMQINYLDAELNGMDENSLNLFKTDNLINWSNLGFSTRNPDNNFVRKEGINSLSALTLSSDINSPLPLVFLLINARCEAGRVFLSWKTAQEQNTSHFNIERSADGINWSVIGSQPAAGNSTDQRSYSFADNDPARNSYYRISEYDLDGRTQYTRVLRSSCDVRDVFSLWPNPVHDKVIINIVTSSASQATIKIFDNKGALVKMQKSTVSPGTNQLRIDTKSWPNGIYSLHIDWNHGQIQKAAQIIKQ